MKGRFACVPEPLFSYTVALRSPPEGAAGVPHSGG